MRGNQVYTECVKEEEGGREAWEETSTEQGILTPEGFNMVLYAVIL